MGNFWFGATYAAVFSALATWIAFICQIIFEGSIADWQLVVFVTVLAAVMIAIGVWNFKRSPR